MIYEYFWVTGTHETILDFSGLMGVALRGDDVLRFDTRWNEVLLSTHDVPSDNILESFVESDQLKTVLTRVDQRILPRNRRSRDSSYFL